MKNDMMVKAVLLLSIAGLMAQGNQPGLFGPQFPQVLGANFPARGGNPNVSTLQFPGCSDIQSVGSPILLTYQAEQLIEEAMKTQTQGSFVRYLYFKKETGAGLFSVLYRLIFEIRDQTTANYVGILLDNPANGIGSVKFLKFIVNPNIETVKKVLKITEDLPAKNYVCGDLKMIFSSFGNDPRSKLPGQFPGQNRNAVSPALLKALKELTATGSASAVYARDCDASHFFRSPAYYSANGFTFNADGSLPEGTIADYSNVRCNPTGAQVMTGLNLSCATGTSFGNNLGRGKLFGVQGVFKTPLTNTPETTPWIGVENPTNPGGSAATANSKIFIDLTQVVRFETYYNIGTSGSPATWYAIATYTADGTRNIVNCGLVLDATILASGVKDNIVVKDLLGFYVGKTSPWSGQTPLSFFGFIIYQ